jgi:plasmid stabilization system protein ParE
VIPRLPYIAVYRIFEATSSTAGEIQVLRLLHGARRWPPRLR